MKQNIIYILLIASLLAFFLSTFNTSLFDTSSMALFGFLSSVIAFFTIVV
jgi:hypothetical protein